MKFGGVLICGVCIAVVSSAFGWCGESPTGELQEKAQELADYAVKNGLQGALQFCAFKDGKCVIDVWAGTMTTNAGSAKIDGDTLFPIFSTEKPLLATAVHRTVEEGKLTSDQPVSTVWPEFTGGGKEKLTVRELLGYRSGMPDNKGGAVFSPEGTRIMSDWKEMLQWFESVPPDIIPGTKQRYMATSYGWAHGGLLEKVWKMPANEVLREQVLIPAGIENDFFFVCGDREIPRIATVYKGEAFESMNDDLARRSFLPSAWAVSSARGLAQFYNRLCGFDGKPPLLKKETLDEALKPCRHPSDPVPNAEELKEWHMIFGMGYGLWGEADDLARVFGHGGIGGSEAHADRSQRIAIGYTCNFDNAPPKLREAFYSLVGISWRYRNQNVNIQDLQMSTMQSDPTKPARPSVASFCKRAEAGERLTIAFFGGSLTWGANATDPNRTSWRALLGERLEREYPKAHFKFVDAAIGGTGSSLGVFRLERDVLKYKPDLVFIDWAVNDGAYSAADDCSASYEGILRKLLKELPDCVPVQVILPDRKTVELADEAKLVRRAEHIAVGEAFGLSRADVLGEMRRRHSIGRIDLGKVWPTVIGDNTHPFDDGYALYADIIWQQVFSVPSDRTVHVPEAWLFFPKYRHVLRADLAKRTDLPKGWVSEPCAMRAGTFDFLCSRWQDGQAVAREGAASIKAKFRGEVLMLYGESAVQSSNCEVYVDGKLAAKRDTAAFGRQFAPSAWLVWQVGTKFDPAIEHTLEIRPVFKPGEKRELRLGSICVAGSEAAVISAVAAEAVGRPAPNAAQMRRIREGVEVYGIVHWGLNTYTDREWGFGDENPKDLNPAKFDAEQIVGVCKAGGLQGLIVVAKHHDGFCLWPTKTTEHNIAKSPFRGGKGDYVKEMEQACRKFGLKFGVYVSPWDRNSALYGTEKYVTDVFQMQIRELLSGDYGEIFEMWFDGANGGDGYYGGVREKRKIPSGYYRYETETFAMVRRLQPNVCIFNESDLADFRFGGNERGIVDPDSRSTGGHYDGVWENYRKWANTGLVNGSTFHPIEADFPLRPGWFYHAKERGKTKNAVYLMQRYLATVGNATTLNLGIAPNRDGLLDEEDVRALKGFKTIRDAFFASPNVDPLSEPFNLIVMRERLEEGELVDRWDIQVNGKVLASGKSIGYKRIRVLDEPVRGPCRITANYGDRPVPVNVKFYSVDPELVRLVKNATTESGETDTAKWMITAADELLRGIGEGKR